MRQGNFVGGAAAALALLAMGCGGGGGEPDRTRPLPVSGFSVTASGADVSGSWTVPEDPDLPAIAGVVVVRLTGMPEAPVDGEKYEVGDLALGGEVVFVGNATSFDDLGLPPGDASYVVFSYTRNRTYGPLAGAATRIALPAQTATLIIDLTDETVTATAPAGQIGLDAELLFTTGNTSGSVYLELSNLSNGILFNPKLVMTSATDQLAADRTLDITGTAGTMPGGGGYFYFGPEALAVGSNSTPLILNFANVDATTVLTLQFDLVTSPMLIGGEFWNSDGEQVLPLFDVEAEAEVGSIRGAPFGPHGYVRPDGGYLSPDGRFLYMGSRNAPEVTVYDMTTLYPVAILPIAGDHARGSVLYIVPAEGGGTLYALFMDGAHAYRWSGSSSRPQGHTTAVHVELVRIDRASLKETGRVRLQTLPDENDTGMRGRRMAISPNGTTMAVPVISNRDDRGIDLSVTEQFGAIHFVDLQSFTEIDTDAATDGVQPLATGDIPLSGGGMGVGNPSVVEWVNDNLLLAGNAWDDGTAPNDVITVAYGGFIEVAISGGTYSPTLYTVEDTHIVELFRDAAGVVHVGGRGNVSVPPYTYVAKRYDAATHALVDLNALIPSARTMIQGPDADHVWIQGIENYDEYYLVDLATPEVVSTLTASDSSYGHWMGVTPF